MTPAAAWSGQFEARAGQDVPAAGVVERRQLGLAFQGVAGDAPLDRLELAGDRAVLGLVVAGDPGIDRHPEIVDEHGRSAPLAFDRIAGSSLRPAPPHGIAIAAVPVARDDRDQGPVCRGDRLFLKPREFESAEDGRTRGGLPWRRDRVNSSSPRPRL